MSNFNENTRVQVPAALHLCKLGYTYHVERTTSTDDMDKFQEAICAFVNDLSGSLKKGYLILRAYDNDGNVGGKVGGDVALMEITDIQKGIIDLVRANASISIDQLAVKLSVKKRTLEREIAKMKQKGYISRTGSPRSGKWEVIIPYNCVIEIVYLNRAEVKKVNMIVKSN